MKRLPPPLRWFASALVLALGAWLLWRALREMDPAQLRSALAAIPRSALVASAIATGVSFACLAAYERLATQWFAPGRIPRAVAWRTGLVAHALANTLGFHPVTALALRLERYRAHGVDAATLARIVAAIGACVASGVVAVLVAAGAWWLWLAGQATSLVLPAGVAGASLLLVQSRFDAQRLPYAQWLPQAILVFGLGFVEMAAALLGLWVLLPAGALPAGPAFVLLFASAAVLGVVSHAPGGVGVFEATFLAAAAPGSRAPVLAALLAYRLVYNLLPCALALIAVAAGGLRSRFSSTAGTSA
jgi:uncharacterized membrane protein YbhN (UPF0104 family)